MVESTLRRHFDYYLGKTEVVIYSVLAVLLAVTALVTIATAGEYILPRESCPRRLQSSLLTATHCMA